MRSAQSNDHRRRRLRLIQAVDRRLSRRSRAAIRLLTVTDDSPESRRELNSFRKKLFDECAGNGSIILQIEQEGVAPIQVRMNRPYLLIGRDSQCDVRLNDQAVQPLHWLLHWVNGRIFCCDVTQRSGFFPDQNPPPAGFWFDQRPLQIGTYQLRLIGSDLTQIDFSPLDRLLEGAAGFPQLGLLFESIDMVEKVWPVSRTLTLIGRSPQCKLRLNHKSVAQVQACLVRTESGCWLIDLANNNTTGVNDRAIRLAPVDVGDTLRIGSFFMNVIANSIPTISKPSTQHDFPQEASDPFLPPICTEKIPEISINDATNQIRSKIEKVRSPIYDDAVVEIGAVLCVTPSVPDIASNAASSLIPSSAMTIGLNVQSKIKSAVVRIQPGSLTGANVSSKNSGQLAKRLPKAKPAESLARLNASDSSLELQQLQIQQSNYAKPDSVPQSPARIDHEISKNTLTEFIKGQKRQLGLLKFRIETLQKVYHDAAGKIISTKTRDALEKPVLEAVKTYEAMEQSLNQFIQANQQQ